MSPEAQNKAIAAALGAKWHQPSPEEVATGSYYQYAPDFTSDLNAMAGAEKMLNGKTVDIRSLYYDNLALLVPNWPKHRDEFFEHDYSMLTATAAQRAEAFLKTLGLWKEEQ